MLLRRTQLIIQAGVPRPCWPGEAVGSSAEDEASGNTEF